MTGERSEPGALVRRSMASAGIVLAFAFVISVPIYVHYFVWPSSDVVPGWFNVLTLLSWSALFLALERGGYFTIRHHLARLLLWRSGRAPWNYVSLLDAAVDRILVRRVGGGYIFVHRMLMEHLAGEAPSAWEPAGTRQSASGGG
jgi:hypothetical protein